MRRLVNILVLAFLAFGCAVAAKRDSVTTIIRSWHLPDALSIADSIKPDTAWIDYAVLDINNAYSIANTWNGNMVSPIQTALFFKREHKSDFIFEQSYIPYLLTPQDIRYYNTTTPYSNISYRKGFTTYREDNDLRFHFTGNLNSRLNLGVSLDYKNAVGLYDSQSAKRFNGALWASYNGDHYSCQGSIMYNTLSNFENGGIKDADYYVTSSLNTYDYPINMTAMSGLKSYSAFFNHRYSICIEKERKVESKQAKADRLANNEKEITLDSVAIDYIPVTTFLHTFEINRGTKRYLERNSQASFYDSTYYNTIATDSANMLRISNTLAVTFEEAFNKWLRFGATVYASHEAERFGNLVLLNDTTRYIDTARWINNIVVGGRLYKNQGRWVHYNFGGNVCLAGYKLGEFNVDGKLNGIIPAGKDSLKIEASAYLKNQQPDFLMQHYYSNHFRWNNDFKKTYRFRVGGEISYFNRWVDVAAKAGFENITRLIYVGYDFLPTQHDGNVQVVEVQAKVNVHTKRFGWENDVVWQHSSSEYLSLPDIALYTNIYYRDVWAKVLNVQIGVDLRYNTAYYAPLLNPATGQFAIQNKAKIGNYPIMSVYANFKLKKVRFYALFTHFNQYFWPTQNYYAMVDYPKNTPVFSAGVSWNFFD